MTPRRRPVDVRPDRLATERVHAFGTRLGWREAEREARAQFPSLPSRAFDLAALAGLPGEVVITPNLVGNFAAVHALACVGFTREERRAARLHLDALSAALHARHDETVGRA